MAKAVVKVKRLPGKDAAAGLPIKATGGSAGFDLRASNHSEIIIAPGKRALIPTGLVLELPAGCEAQIRPRSGLAWKFGVTLLNSPGTIDSDYRGEVKVILVNLGERPFRVRKGDRIAQMVISRCLEVVLREENELANTRRGRGGFGHSGVNAPAGRRPRPPK